MLKTLVKREAFLFFLYLAAATFFSPAYAEIRVKTSFWQDKKSQHFIIYYQGASPEYVNNLINSAEKYYNDIVDELGFRRFDFWTWDNRCKIYLYDRPTDYLQETGRVAWSAAMVNIKKRTIKTFINQEMFLDSILPHEMAHIIFREFVGVGTGLPLWMDEGVACSQEKIFLDERLQFAAHLIKSNMHLKLKRLSTIKNFSLVVPKTFYSESASILVFLLQNFGKEEFLDFCRALKDKDPWEQALLETYRFASLEEMEEQWNSFAVKFALNGN